MDVWYKFLASVRSRAPTLDPLEESEVLHAMAMIRRVLAVRQQLLGDTHIATGEARYTLGLLHLFIGEHAAAHRNVDAAAGIYTQHLGADHPSSRDVVHVLKCIDEAVALGGTGMLPPMTPGVELPDRGLESAGAHIGGDAGGLGDSEAR